MTAANGGGFVVDELRVSGWSTPSGPVDVGGAKQSVTLMPGRYRFVVFADAPVVLTIPLSVGSSLTVAATQPTRAKAILVNLLQQAPVVAAANRTSVIYAGAVLLSQTYLRARAHQGEVVAQCFAPSSANVPACLPGQALGYTSVYTTPGGVGDGYSTTFAAVYNHDLPSGQHADVLLDAADVDAPTVAEQLIVTA